MDVNIIVVFAVAIIMALAFGLLGFFKEWLETGASFDYAKLAATLVYSIVVGILAVMTGVFDFSSISNWQSIFSTLWVTNILIYTGLLYVFTKIVIPTLKRLTTKTTLFPKKFAAGLIRKMDEESRGYLVFDLPEQLKPLTLACVNAAEAVGDGKGTYQYAIETGAWLFLIEGGELTGAKHYYYKGWLGASVVRWKPISDGCLTKIRVTSKFPDYDKLY